MNNGCRQVDPDNFTRVLHIALFYAVERYFALEESLGKLHIRSYIIRMCNIDKRHLGKCLFLVTHHSAESTIDFRETIVPSHKGETERSLFEHSTETLFALAQRGFSNLALCNIADRPGD